MPAAHIILEGDDAMADVPPSKIEHLVPPEIRFVLLKAGMESGAYSVALGIPRGDGTWLLVETSHAVFDMAAHAFTGRIQYDAEHG